jgi:phospholipase C
MPSRYGIATLAIVVSILLLSTTVPAQIPPGAVEHVIIIFQENRTPDNLFHDPVLMANGADIASYGVNSKGQQIELTGEPLADTYDLNHGEPYFVLEYNNGLMNGADKVKPDCKQPGTQNCIPPDPQFKYVNASDVEPYFQLAEQYTFADHMFQTNEGPSYPAHQFIVSGTSAPSADSPLFQMGAALGIPGADHDTGCTAPAQEYVTLIDAEGQQDGDVYPCFEHATITDLLDNAGYSWAYYDSSPDTIWNGLNIIDHIRLGPDWKYVIPNSQRILTDIEKSRLANVSWVIPPGQASDHPGTNQGEGPSWVASIVNAVGSSSYWSNTVIFVTWDDWGGWYDHVAPTVVNDGMSWGSGYVYGLRVPLVVVSPFANPGYISHVTHDFGSILKFMEENYGLPSLGFADAYADDLSDCFNFGTFHSFRHVKAPLNADYFIHDTRPATPPDDY